MEMERKYRTKLHSLLRVRPFPPIIDTQLKPRFVRGTLLLKAPLDTFCFFNTAEITKANAGRRFNPPEASIVLASSL